MIVLFYLKISGVGESRSAFQIPSHPPCRKLPWCGRCLKIRWGCGCLHPNTFPAPSRGSGAGWTPLCPRWENLRNALASCGSVQLWQRAAGSLSCYCYPLWSHPAGRWGTNPAAHSRTHAKSHEHELNTSSPETFQSDKHLKKFQLQLQWLILK